MDTKFATVMSHKIQSAISQIEATRLHHKSVVEDELSAPVQCKASNADEALQFLKDGNARFLADQLSNVHHVTQSRRRVLQQGQRPHAIILCCSDSRAPPELVFDQGLGDIFIVRVAGNTIDSTAAASILYAVHNLGAPLIVVMGHEACGAIKASLASDELLRGAPADLHGLVAKLRGAYDRETLPDPEEDKQLTACVSNVEHLVHQLKHYDTLEELVATEKCRVVGAYYNLFGAVTFFDEGVQSKMCKHEQHEEESC